MGGCNHGLRSLDLGFVSGAGLQGLFSIRGAGDDVVKHNLFGT